MYERKALEEAITCLQKLIADSDRCISDLKSELDSEPARPRLVVESENEQLREQIQDLHRKIAWWERWAEDFGPGPVRRLWLRFLEVFV